MYKVIKKFKDTDGKIYEVGDIYPNGDNARLEVLSTNKNKYGYPFLEQIEIKKARAKKAEAEVEAE